MWPVRFRTPLMLVLLVLLLALSYKLLMNPMWLVPPLPTLPPEEKDVEITDQLLFRDFQARDWEECDSPSTLPILLNNDMWQHPYDSSYFALSAYPDRRLRVDDETYAYVRVIAMRDGYHSQEIHCQLKYKNLTESVPAQVTVIWERRWDPQNVGRLYDPVLVSCPLRIPRPMPLQVSLTTTPCGPTDTALTVNSTAFRQLQRAKQKKGFAVCVKALDFDDDITDRLVEWIELQRVIGADHIFFYYFHTTDAVYKVLEHYSNRGIVTVINMTLPGFQPNYTPERSRYLRVAVWQKRRDELIHYNDCLYRNIYKYRFVVPIDIDEVIVPLKYHTWPELIEHLEELNPELIQMYASLSVRHVYVFDNLTRVQDEEIPKYLHMMRHTERASNISRRGYSSKSFVSTRGALTVFNHYALHTLYPEMEHETRVVPSQALVYHYRPSCPEGILQECRDKYYRYTQRDRTLQKYLDELTEPVKATRKALGLEN